MSRISVFLTMAFLLTVINGLYLPKEENEDNAVKRGNGVYPSVSCSTNSDCQPYGNIASLCLMSSSGRGTCIVQDESTEKRSLSQSTGFGCESEFDCMIRYGYHTTCQWGICINKTPGKRSLSQSAGFGCESDFDCMIGFGHHTTCQWGICINKQSDDETEE